MNDKENRIIETAYLLLTGKISKEELNTYDIKYEVLDVLADKNYLLARKLDRRLIRGEIEKAQEFNLNKFLDREDYDYQFPYTCAYNEKTSKAALGLIFDNKSFFCNVPLNSSHASVVTELYRMNDPDYEDLNLYSFKNRQTNDSWQDKIMREENCIIIHFIPNALGTIFFIPKDITYYQREELERINKSLLKKGIIGEICEKEETLVSYLANLKRNDELFSMICERKKEEGKDNIVII